MSRWPSAIFAPRRMGHYGAGMSAATLPFDTVDPAALFQLSAPLASQALKSQSLEGRRIVVAMSGGVDSSVVAALAAASGAETIGVTLQLYDYGAATGRKGACCAGDDIRDARAVADRLGIAHYVFDHESRFREDVVERFADEYLAGRTPIPCIRCNMGPKFTDLFAMARELGADCLATGHYVRRVPGPAGPELPGSMLYRALDPARDQSYFLFATTEAQLDYLRFPLGGLPKSEVRRIAEAAGLKTLDAELLKNTNRMKLYVFANEQTQQVRLAAVLDNLGKGASGAAVQNLNIMLGLPETTGLA